MDQNWMNNTTVIVTGASGGMGKGIAESLIVDHGCTVIGIARSEEKMKKVVEELVPMPKNSAISFSTYRLSKIG